MGYSARMGHARAPFISLAVMACGGLTLAGCSGYRDPSIVLSDARVLESTDEALTLRFTMDLTNPNDDPLKLVQFEYDLMVDGVKVYSGMRAAEATLASNSERQMHIPAVVLLDDLGWTPTALPPAAGYSIRGSVEYVTPGEIAQILFDTGVRTPQANFRGAGEVALSGHDSRQAGAR